MIYSSPEFIIFFSITFLAYVLAPRRGIRFFILLISSLLFYSWAGTIDLLIFLAVVLISWLSVWLSRKQPKHKKVFAILGISLMAAHLIFWKYGGWIVAQIQILDPHFLAEKIIKLPLPVGISFFTLQGIAYIVDFYKGPSRVYDAASVRII